MFNRLTTYRWRTTLVQKSPRMLRRLLNGFLQRVAADVDADGRLLRRFAREMTSANVTHMLPGLEVLSSFVEAARRLGGLNIRYLVTFQSYEVCLNGTDDPDLKRRLMAVIHESVNRSDFPAIAVGKHYRERILREIGLVSDQIVVLHPCVEEPTHLPPEIEGKLVADTFPGFQAAVPLVAFVGRQDVEKGLDLLLYAAALCRSNGFEFQLLICGPSALGNSYGQICRQIASHLQLPVMWGGMVSDELRSAIFQMSRVVVYPSIHGEPYGMAPMEAMLHGSQAIVAENSGIVDNNPDVLTFPAGDSRSLANCMAVALRNNRQLKPVYTTPRQLAGQLMAMIVGQHE